MVPFQVSLTEAQRAFERWQQAHWLAPARVLRRGQTEMRALLLPFWLFEAAFQVEYTGASRVKAATAKLSHWGRGGLALIALKLLYFCEKTGRCCAVRCEGSTLRLAGRGA